MNPERNDPKSLILLTVSMLAFGSIGIFRRLIPLSSALIAFFRGVIGCIFLLIFVLLQGKRRGKLPERKKILLLFITGALIGINWVFLFESYNYTTVSIATLCYYMEPTFLILFSCILFREKMTAKKTICTVIALIGMILISGILETGIPGEGEGKGILFGLAAACFYASVVLLNKSITGVDAYIKTMIQLAAASAVLVPYLVLTDGFVSSGWSVSAALLLLLIGAFHTGLCYTMYFGSMEGVKTHTLALFSYIDPVTALILSAIILKERMSFLSIVGAVLILGSAMASEFERKTA
ncbi:MAG: EamA family transporter [Oscillospiraceae bacterium]|nr:EamA family transporter [Oscillospiraceae bacterium]